MNKNNTLQLCPHVTEIDPFSRIYINRNLKMESITHIGFDMDHTLAVYSEEMQLLAFNLTKQKLVHNYGYPPEILGLEYEQGAVIRGLVVDKVKGNIIKLDHHKYVENASHGTYKLNRQERKKVYTRPGESYRPNSGDFYYLDTLFCLPEACLFMKIVDYFDTNEGEGAVNYKKVYDDIRESIDLTHKDGTLKSEVIENMERYVIRDLMLPKTLSYLIENGKKLFLLTNSEYYYTDIVMNYLLGVENAGHDNWQDYFELIVVSARKPAFFLRDKGLTRPDSVELGEDLSTDNMNKIYCGGGFRALEVLLKSEGESILYFGDHTFGDVLKSKQTCGWRTCMIIKELDFELSVLHAQRRDRDHLETLQKKMHETQDDMRQIDSRMSYLRSRKLEYYEDMPFEEMKEIDGEIGSYQELLLKKEESATVLLQQLSDLEKKLTDGYNKNWGSLFKSGRRKSRFGDQVEDFACLYTSKVTNFLLYPATKYFRISDDLMAHEREEK